MKHFLLFVLTITGIQNVNSQNFLWAKTCGISGAIRLAKDSSHNFYLAGGNYLQKYDATGNWIWTQNVPSIRCLTVDSSGNVYVLGAFGATTIVVSGVVLTSSSSGGHENIYLAKYDKNGVFQWLERSFGLRTPPDAITLDKLGNPIILGRFNGNLNLNTFALNSTSYFDIYLAKYSSSGGCLWAKQLKSYSFDTGVTGPQIKTDNLGNSYIFGKYEDWASFDSIYINSLGVEDVFLTKFDANGVFLWAKTMGGPGYQEHQTFDVDKLGNSYVCGEFGGPICYFDSLTLTGTAARDYFTAKYDSNGSCLWAKYKPLPGTGNVVAYDSGYYATYPAFLAKYDGAGTQEWSKIYTGSGSASNKAMVVVQDSLFITGGYVGTVEFDSHSLSSSTNINYIAKLGPPPIITSIEDQQRLVNLFVYPNPCYGNLNFKYKSDGTSKELSLNIKNALGQSVFTKNYKIFTGELTDIIDLSKQAKGMYFIELQTDKKTETKKITLN